MSLRMPSKEMESLLKIHHKERSSISKKSVAEFGEKVTHELVSCLEDLVKAKNNYEKAAIEHESAAKKFESVSNKSIGTALKSIVTGKDHDTQVNDQEKKLKAKTKHLDQSRNEYILTLITQKAAFHQYMASQQKTLLDSITTEKKISDANLDALKQAVTQFNQTMTF